MNQNLLLIARCKIIRLINNIIMSKNNEKVYYAVACGREVGVYDSWKDCKIQIDGISNAKFKKFFSFEEATEFVNFWKNYASTKEAVDPSVSKPSNKCKIVNTMNDEEKYSTIGNRRITKKKRCYELSSKKNFVLGCENNEAKDCNNSLLKTFKLPYVSPINCFIDTRDFNNKIPVNREAESDKYMTEAIKEDIKVEDTQCVNLEEKLNKSTTNDTISEQFSSIIPNNTQNSVNTLDSSNLVTSSPSIILPDSSVTMHFEKNISSFNTVMASESENIKEVKIEKTINTEHLKVLESSVPDNSTPSKNDTTLLNNSNELSMCINSLRITLMLMIKEKISSTGEIVRSLKLLINELITDTNGNVNPQIPMEEVDGGSGNEQQTFMCRQETSSSLSQVEQQTSQTSNYALSLSPQSLAVDSKCEQKNVDVLALNLRMDSFEKRYDTCLKELGGIISEMSNIKSEIKEIKETLATLQGISLPRQKGGMLQTALNMGGNSSRVENSFSDGNKTFPQLQSSLSSRFYSLGRDDDDFGEQAAKKPKILKKKLSKTDKSDFKDCANEDDSDSVDCHKVKREAVDYTSFTVDSDDYVQVYTDGACHLNGKKGAKAGIGIWFGDCHPLNVAEPVVGKPTNNLAEIQAARVAIELAVKAGVKKLKIFTDSEFLINCITKWIHRWKKNGWKLVDGGIVKNKVELEKLDEFASKISVRWEKVEGHAGIKGNEMADRLANEGASRYTR